MRRCRKPANFAADDVEALLIWREIVEKRLRSLEKQIRDLSAKIAQLAGPVPPGNGDGRDYIDLLNRHLSEDDVRNLAFRFHIDYDDLEGDTRQGKILSLVEEMSRDGRLPQLQQAVKERRPKVDWPPFI